MFTEKEEEQLKRLVDEYTQLKRTILYVESIESEVKSHIQVIKEFRDSYDHVQSILREKLSSDSDKDEEYFLSNIDKALGHIYRASFDAFDGLFTFMKKDLAAYLKCYSPKTCNTVIKDYFETKKNIKILSKKLGELRGQKDSGKDLSPIFDSYVKEIEIFKAIKSDLENYSNELDEVQLAENKEENRGKRIRLKGYSVTILAVILGCLLTWFITTQCSRQDPESNTPDKAKTEATSPENEDVE